MYVAPPDVRNAVAVMPNATETDIIKFNKGTTSLGAILSSILPS